MKIIVVHNAYLHKGGEDSVMEAEVELLKSRGHAVELFLRHNSALNEMSAATAAVQTFWSSPVAREFEERLRTFKPDVVHVHNSFPMISPAIYWVANRLGVPIVQTLHNFRLLCPQAMFLREGKVCEDCLGKVPWRGAVHGCYRDSKTKTALLASMVTVHRAVGTWQDKVTRYIALNEFCRNKFIEGGLPAARILLKPNFVDFAAPAAGARSGFLFVGRLSAEKGIDVLVAAVKTMDGVSVRVAGTGTESEKLLGVLGVHALGALTSIQVRTEMSQATAVVVPSIWFETFGMVVVESFAAGTPVIASRIGVLPNLVIEGKTGLLFDPGNPQDLAQKMQWALQHPDQMAEMGRNARAVYEAEFTADRNYQQLIAIYDEAIAAVKTKPQPRLTKHSRHTVSVLRASIDAVDWDTALARIAGWSAKRESRYVCICNAHSVVTTRQDPAFGRVVKEADMATPDGAPVAWMMRKLGVKDQQRINGPDLMWRYCAQTAQRNESIYLYGGVPETLVILQARLAREFPGLRVAGAYSPPFRALTPEEDAADVKRINDSGAGTVWVSLGCPKQELWMAAHRGRINAVMVGVGAAFDYHAGTIQRAPVWMQHAGLEWFHRLASEPRRLWRRYLVTNTLFVLGAARQLLLNK